MATYDNRQPISLVASVDMTGFRNRFVKQHTVAGEIALAGAGENAIGVLQDKPVQSQAGNVAIDGKLVLLAGGVFAPGDKIASDAQGRAIAAVAGNHVLGVAATNGVSGSMSEVHFSPAGVLPA